VRHTYDTPDKLVLLELGKVITDPLNETIPLYTERLRSPEYLELTREFVTFDGSQNGY